jgi:large subunit ribosomal protein L1
MYMASRPREGKTCAGSLFASCLTPHHRRILRAYEVGKPPGVVKYELHINLKTFRNGPVIKSSIRLPNPVQSDWQIAVVCPEGSEIAVAATNAGAKAVGEETLFELIRNDKIEFDRLICHESSEKALMRANLGKILGPRGLMPNRKMKTIVSDVVKAVKDSAGAADYRERQGVVRLAVGQLGHTPAQLKANVEAVMKKIKTECAEISEDIPKDVHEVILSTTHGPALSLNGKMKNIDDTTTPEDVAGVM